MLLAPIAYFQPTPRRELGNVLDREISRDTLADLRGFDLIANGPKSSRAGPPTAYVTTAEFLSRFGLNTLQDLPDRESIENTEITSSPHAERRNFGTIFRSSEEAPEDPETFEGAEF
jgi:segregation and condensation protein B